MDTFCKIGDKVNLHPEDCDNDNSFIGVIVAVDERGYDALKPYQIKIIASGHIGWYMESEVDYFPTREEINLFIALLERVYRDLKASGE